jgi:hypothetical protein
MLEEELAPLNEQIELVRQKKEAFEGDLRRVEAELEAFSADRQRFDALRDVCTALDRLGKLQADELFWEEGAVARDAAGHIQRAKERIARFEKEISGIIEQQASLKEKINRCQNDLEILHEEVRDAYDREERRKEEFAIEREISPVPYRAMVMPWTREVESEMRFRKAIIMAMSVCLVFGSLIPMINVPIPDLSYDVIEIPERLVRLVKEDLPKPAPVQKPEPEQALDEKEQKKEEPKQKKDEPRPDEQKTDDKPKLAADDGKALEARKKAESVGVLKFKKAFADLMNETPVASLGTEAPLSNDSPRVKGEAVARRSLVAMQANGGSSGGIGNAGVSRNVGNGNAGRIGGGGNGIGIGGTGFTRVESNIADLEESSRPMSDGLAPGRTDEEIQIVFDRYKAALYRIYNKQLRNDPTLRGKILMRITIEPNGAVSLCKVESTDLASDVLVARIVARIKRFNFGPKEGVQQMTILYPIDFLPAG